MPSISSRPLMVALVVVAAAAAPMHLSAQLGGLAKKAKAALADKPAAAVVAPVEPVGPVRVKASDRIDAASLDLFAQALVAERTWLDDQAQVRKSMRSPADYRTCSEGAMQNSPEAKQLMKVYTDAMTSSDNDGSVEYMTKVANKMKVDQDRIIFAACGHDPADYAGERNPSALIQPSEQAAASKVGLDLMRYAMLKERITPFCGLDPAARGTGEVRIPGSGRRVFYVYEPAEVDLLAPRCDDLMRAMKAVA